MRTDDQATQQDGPGVRGLRGGRLGLRPAAISSTSGDTEDLRHTVMLWGKEKNYILGQHIRTGRLRNASSCYECSLSKGMPMTWATRWRSASDASRVAS